VKESDDGHLVVVRLYEAEGAPSEAKVLWLGEERALREANLLEDESDPSGRRAVPVTPYEIKTIRLERAG
jgi:alpha-mannosidase